MHSKNTLHLIESRPQRIKIVHKYSQTLLSALQRTTNQITPLASTLEKPESFTASTNARIKNEIVSTTNDPIICHANCQKMNYRYGDQLDNFTIGQGFLNFLSRAPP